MKNICILLLMLLVATTSYNCSSDDSTEPIPDGGTDPISNPDPNPNKTTTYTADVKVIIDNECIRCHTNPPANRAPFSMRNYQEIIDAIRIGRRDIVGPVETTGRNVMPPEGRLPQETVDIFLDWEADGFLEE